MINVLFVGSKRMGLVALRSALRIPALKISEIVTCEDSADGRSELAEFRELAAREHLELHVVRGGGDLRRIVGATRPELCLVVGWYWIIDGSTLAMPRLGFAGIHASLLPKYRGASPLVWSILRGEKQTGISLFLFDAGMDTGGILFQKAFALGENDTIADVLVKAEGATEEAIRTALPRYVQGTLRPRSQNERQATYAAARLPSDGLINWSQSNREIFNFVRAQSQPYPGAFSRLPDQRKVTIWEARMFTSPYFGVAGQIVQFVGKDPVVCCGDGALILTRVSAEPQAARGADRRLRYNMRLG